MRSKQEVLEEHYGVDSFSKSGYFIVNDKHNHRPPLDQWTTLKLPYEAPTHPPIPSVEEIVKTLSKDPYGRIGECIVKMNENPRILQEAENILYLQNNSQVRTPKVYAVFGEHCLVEGKLVQFYFLVMEAIEGFDLTHEAFEALDDEARKKIGAKISEHFGFLRAVPSEGYYGRVHRQGWDPSTPMLRMRYKEMPGPYNTYEDLVSAMFTTAELNAAISMSGEDFPERVPRILSTLKSNLMKWEEDHEPTLTHLYPCTNNFVVRSFEEDGETNWEVVMDSWNQLCWLPPWAQAVANFESMFYFDNGGTKQRISETLIHEASQCFQKPYDDQVEYFKELKKINYSLF
ncbi:hypothetical protein K505DRAFT_368773 [Melanomma pulvis-pyrius CBS 109.77]|uniref:Aminoglycoside phosphotransferase domain-containing protein n=1 Tax=Melanomma pulvis-pyrius CBS 109.77 TaxID=1314802 RepID=A0A6A6WPP7_9PLEO|nr:hypothetical protein K505DRAFT_368773 [Melanomma pulvis-pyrius CBS 109.77]